MEFGAATDRGQCDRPKGASAITALPPAVSGLLVGLGVAQAFRQARILHDQGRFDEASVGGAASPERDPADAEAGKMRDRDGAS